MTAAWWGCMGALAAVLSPRQTVVLSDMGHPGLGWQLEGRGEAEGEAAGGGDGVAGEEAAEVDDVEAVVEVVAVGLEAGGEAVGLLEIGAE